MIMSKSRKQGSQSATPGAAQKRFNRLIAKLVSSTDAEERNTICKQLAHAARMLNVFAKETNRRRSSVPMPASRKAYIETAARISGRKAIRAHMVQGGAPGTGGGGGRK